MNKEEQNLPVVLPNQIMTLPPSSQIDLVPEFVMSFDAMRERLKLFQEFVNEFMIPGIDYGIIKGCKKPSLFKSGAEKLCDIYGFSKKAEVINCTEDWDKGVFSYQVKAILISKRTRIVEAEGLGSCNSREKAYRDKDPYGLVNTLVKMAKKRAFVDAVLNATRSSGLFTQDVEDLDLGEPVNSEQHTGTVLKMATPNQRKTILKLTEQINMPVNSVEKMLIDRYKVKSATDLTLDQADNLIKHLLSIRGIEVVK